MLPCITVSSADRRQLELLASIWAFGFKFFKSWFHCLDATVITVGFVIDVLLKGMLEEIGSLVVVLRLWRVFKVRFGVSDITLRDSC